MNIAKTDSQTPRRFSSKWKTKRLGEIGSFSKGRGIKRDDVTDEGMPCIRYGELYTRYQNYILKAASRIPPDIAATALPIQKGDLLFAGSGETAEEIGRCAAYLSEEQAYAGGDVIVLTPSGQNSIYLSHLMNSPMVSEQKARLGQGDAVVHIYINNLAQVKIKLPPITEQNAIAEALSDVDGLLNALEALIAKKQAIKQATMQQLLTGKTRLPGFSGEWKTKRLGDIGSFSKGRGIKRDEVSDEGVPCVRYGELYTRYQDYILKVASRIPPSVAATALPIKKGDLLFAGSGETAEEIGKCAAYLSEEQAYAGGDVIVLTSSGQNSMYLGHLMNSPTVSTQKVRMGQGDAVVHIYINNLAQVQIALPSITEQNAIASVLSDMDAEITALTQRRDKTRAIKQGMMQQLLTGRVRLSESRICTDDTD